MFVAAKWNLEKAMRIIVPIPAEIHVPLDILSERTMLYFASLYSVFRPSDRTNMLPAQAPLLQ